MKDIPHEVIQRTGMRGLTGTTVAFVVSVLPFFQVELRHTWTEGETYLSAMLLIGTALLVVFEAHYLRFSALSIGRIPEIPDIGRLVGFFLYFFAIGCMVIVSGIIPAVHFLVYASAAIFYANRLLLLYPSNTGKGPSLKDWKRFALVFLVELLVFGIILWFFYFRSV
jgi:hypothetical protein